MLDRPDADDARPGEAIVKSSMVAEQRRDKTETEEQKRHDAGRCPPHRARRIDGRAIIGHHAGPDRHFADRLTTNSRERVEMRHFQQPEERGHRHDGQHAPLRHRKSRHAQGEIHHGGVDAEQDEVIDENGNQPRAGAAWLARDDARPKTLNRLRVVLSGGADRSTTSSENCSMERAMVARPIAAYARSRGVSGVLLTASGARGADGSLISGSSSSSCVGVKQRQRRFVAAAEPDDMNGTIGGGADGWKRRLRCQRTRQCVVERLVDIIARTWLRTSL
jgi:hypothetical protein